MNFLARIFLLALLAGCAPLSPTGSPTRFKFFVTTTGWHRVTGMDLRHAGADLANLDVSTLQLFRGEHPVALRVYGVGNQLVLEFYGQASDSPDSAFNVYWLTWGIQPGARMREIFLPAPALTPATWFEETVRWSPAHLYAPQPGDATPSWFWQSLDAPITTTIPITLPHATAGHATMRVNVWGNSDDPVTPNHHLQIQFNGTPIADEWWSGRGAHAFEVALARVRAGGNTLTFIAPGDTRALADLLLLHSIEVTYTRRLVAQNNQLEFQTRAGTYRIAEFSDDALELFDLTDPDNPACVMNPTRAGGALTFATSEPGTRRWLARHASAPTLAPKIAPMPPTHLRASANQADYLIVTHPDFVSAVCPLAQWRAQHGLTTRVVTTDEIYDEFNYGAVSPVAIRAFLVFTQREWRKPAPRWVLLLGKASYDTRDVLNAPNKNLVPTFLVDTLNAEKIASDHLFVVASATDLRPSLAIGRLPAKTAAHVTRVVNKIIAYEAGVRSADWHARALFVADDKAPEFVMLADALTARLPTGMRAHKIYLRDYAGEVRRARAELFARWNEGASLITYVGHGALDLWAAGPLLSTAHVGDIKNGARLPILFTPTCLDGFFNHPRADSLVEELLFNAEGGIVAGIAPTGVSFTEAQDALMRALWDELFSGARPTLGEALMRAKQKLAVDSREFVEVIETFGLLGDPALVPRIGN